MNIIRKTLVSCTIFCLIALCVPSAPAGAVTDPAMLENAMSATLDLWRENWIEQLYERLALRGATSRDQFVERMRAAPIRPACCWQKLGDFKVLSENGSEATVSAKIGLEITEDVPSETTHSGTRSVTTLEYTTREFRLIREGGVWKMPLNDIDRLRSYQKK
jgi:hypothetical protein